MILEGVEVLGLATADGCDGLVRRLTLRLIAFFEDGARQVGGELAGR